MCICHFDPHLQTYEVFPGIRTMVPVSFTQVSTFQPSFQSNWIGPGCLLYLKMSSQMMVCFGSINLTWGKRWNSVLVFPCEFLLKFSLDTCWHLLMFSIRTNKTNIYLSFKIHQPFPQKNPQYSVPYFSALPTMSRLFLLVKKTTLFNVHWNCCNKCLLHSFLI